jgi:hypothetical protein
MGKPNKDRKKSKTLVSSMKVGNIDPLCEICKHLANDLNPAGHPVGQGQCCRYCKHFEGRPPVCSVYGGRKRKCKDFTPTGFFENIT